MESKTPMVPSCECRRPDCDRCAAAEFDRIEAMLRQEFATTEQDAPVPRPELVWYRAQMRARDEAARAAARPILFAQALAMAALIGLVASLTGRLWTLLPQDGWRALSFEASGALLTAIAFAVGAWVVLAPLAAYFVLSRD